MALGCRHTSRTEEPGRRVPDRRQHPLQHHVAARRPGACPAAPGARRISRPAGGRGTDRSAAGHASVRRALGGCSGRGGRGLPLPGSRGRIHPAAASRLGVAPARPARLAAGQGRGDYPVPPAGRRPVRSATQAAAARVARAHRARWRTAVGGPGWARARSHAASGAADPGGVRGTAWCAR